MRGTRNVILSEARTSLPHAAQMNDVEALPQMKLPLANDVGLRPTMLRFAQTELSRSLGALIGSSELSFQSPLIFYRRRDIID